VFAIQWWLQGNTIEDGGGEGASAKHSGIVRSVWVIVQNETTDRIVARAEQFYGHNNHTRISVSEDEVYPIIRKRMVRPSRISSR
jgi:hypothetical protein